METIVGVEVPPNVSAPDAVANSGNTPGFSGKWSDFSKDMELLAQQAPIETDKPAEISPVVVEAAVVPTPVAPIPPVSTEPVTPQVPPVQPPAATVTVPEKFQAPDGSPDLNRILKSYAEAEKTLKRLQNAPQQPQAQPVPVVATPEANTFEAQVYQDFITSGLDQRAAAALVPTITKLFAAASDAGYSRAMNEVSSFKQTVEETRMREELKAIVANDPSTMTPEGIKTLIEIRQEQPWLNQSPEPWKAAWQVKIANEALKRSAGSGQVQTPTPKAVTAPNAPVTAAPIVAETPVVLNDAESIRNHLKGLTDAQKGEFFRRNLGQKIKW